MIKIQKQTFFDMYSLNVANFYIEGFVFPILLYLIIFLLFKIIVHEYYESV